ncbi:hypothetical protein DFJ58DRAFT_844371, partial [Suillus subalutaceus]|uniref:uncharacterized protein n=1 Tax=Suillus subalutaceus TaxID=48586 RepID=UPI001B85BF65
MPSSLKKKRSKRKAMDSDPKELEALAKRARAGTGGRGAQLEKIGAILHAPVRTSKSKGATSLDPAVPANPLAPQPPRKGRRSHSKPFTRTKHHNFQITLEENKDSCCFCTNLRVIKPSAYFSQREAGGRYGFSPPIVPPSTEPDLQALNNSFVAASKERHALPVPNHSQSQTHATIPAVKGRVPSSTSLTTVVLPDADFYKNLDPALRMTRPSGTQSEQSDTSKDESSSSDESNGNEQMGWGEVHGHHSTHPGFLREEPPPQPQVVTALPTDFEFQYSRDEGDEVAKKTFTVGGDLSEDGTTMDQESDPNLSDVLNLHHKRNGRPRLPDPALLELLRAAKIDASNSKAKQKRKHKQKSKSKQKSRVVNGSESDRWYSSRWKSFLEDAKAECRTQQALDNPFPSLIHDLPVSITESLLASLVQWLKNGQQVDAGVWPARKPDMARLLYDDLATWHSDLKKIAISITSSAYSLSPLADIPVEERAAWVEAATTELLDGGRFLHFGLDELGKTRNFAHPALLQAIVLFFYTGTYRVA